MSHSKRLKDTGSQFDKLVSYGYGAPNKQYIAAKSWWAKLDAYQYMGGNNGKSDPLFLAKAAFELAATAPTDALANELLVEAVAKAQQAKIYRSLSPARAVLTDMFTINLPLLTAVHIDKKHPSPELIDKARTEGAISLQQTYPETKLPERAGREYAGAAAELGALVFLQRFSVEQLDGEQWTPVPSLISQDCDSKIGSSQNTNWDMSVYTGDNGDLSYMVQVKFGNQVKPIYYHDAISVLNVKHDLALADSEKAYGINSLVAELSQAHSERHTPELAETLDIRTNQMMNIIDPPAAEF